MYVSILIYLQATNGNLVSDSKWVLQNSDYFPLKRMNSSIPCKNMSPEHQDSLKQLFPWKLRTLWSQGMEDSMPESWDSRGLLLPVSPSGCQLAAMHHAFARRLASLWKFIHSNVFLLNLGADNSWLFEQWSLETTCQAKEKS